MKQKYLTVLISLFLFSCELFEPEQEEPTVKITSPKNNSYVHEIVTITADADDNKGIVYVEFYIDGETSTEMEDLISPYSYEWNVINIPDSSVHTIFAKAVDTDDNISSSKMVTVTINNQLGTPEPVQLEASISTIDSSVILQWSKSTIDDFSYYSIYRDINPGISNLSDHLSTINKDTVIKYIDTNILDNTTYYYAVYVFDQYGFYSISNEVEISVPNKPPTPVFLHNPMNVTDSTMLLMWDKSQIHDFKKYSLFRSLSSNPDQTANLIFETANIDQNSHSDINLEKGIIYYYRLAIYDNGDLFSLSNIVYDTAITKVQYDNTLTDIDGNVYKTVKIGDQWWMAENLKTLHYQNGEAIPNVTSNNTWIGIKSGAYCDYSNDDSKVETYGRLYNWYSVVDSRSIAPVGWHVPSDAEWNALVNYLGGVEVAGGKIKEAGTNHWLSPNTGATNESGFTALPSGNRGHLGEFGAIQEATFFWTTTEANATGGFNWRMNYSSAIIEQDGAAKCYGFPVRCVKD